MSVSRVVARIGLAFYHSGVDETGNDVDLKQLEMDNIVFREFIFGRNGELKHPDDDDLLSDDELEELEGPMCRPVDGVGNIVMAGCKIRV